MDTIPRESDYSSFANLYDLIYSLRQDDIPMYLDFGAAANGPILELGCGSGRVLLPMAQAGYQMVGLDSAKEMLSLARSRLDAAGLAGRVTLVEGDMTDFDLAGRFDLIYVPINTFMHCYTQGQQLSCLGCVRRHLNAGGKLVVDVFHPDPQSLTECDGRIICDRIMSDPHSGHTIQHSYFRRLDRAEQIQHVTFLVDEIDHGRHVSRTVFPVRMRFVYRYEMELLLRTAGFSLENLYGSYDLEPFENDSEKMIFVACADWAG